MHHEITGESNPHALGRAVLAKKTADSGDKRPADPNKMPGPLYDLPDKQLYTPTSKSFEASGAIFCISPPLGSTLKPRGMRAFMTAIATVAV